MTGAHIQNFKFVRQKLWPTEPVQTDGRTDRRRTET